MEFNEEKAQEIISKYELSEKTLRVWKTRRSIPDKYANEGYGKVEPIFGNGDKLMQERIISILNMPELNRKTIVELSNCNLTRVNGVCAHKSTFTKEEMFALQKEIKRLRLDILKYTSRYSESFSKIVKDKRIKLFVIIKDKYFARKLNYNATTSISYTDFKQAVDYFVRFAIQLNID